MPTQVVPQRAQLTAHEAMSWLAFGQFWSQEDFISYREEIVERWGYFDIEMLTACVSSLLSGEPWPVRLLLIDPRDSSPIEYREMDLKAKYGNARTVAEKLISGAERPNGMLGALKQERDRFLDWQHTLSTAETKLFDAAICDHITILAQPGSLYNVPNLLTEPVRVPSTYLSIPVHISRVADFIGPDDDLTLTEIMSIPAGLIGYWKPRIKTAEFVQAFGVPLPTDNNGEQHTRPASVASISDSGSDLREWYLQRVKEWPAEKLHPDRADDLDAARKMFGKVRRETVWQVRAELAPIKWKATGPNGRKKSRHAPRRPS